MVDMAHDGHDRCAQYCIDRPQGRPLQPGLKGLHPRRMQRFTSVVFRRQETRCFKVKLLVDRHHQTHLHELADEFARFDA